MHTKLFLFVINNNSIIFLLVDVTLVQQAHVTSPDGQLLAHRAECQANPRAAFPLAVRVTLPHPVLVKLIF